MEIFLGERLHIKLPLLDGYASHPIFSKKTRAILKSPEISGYCVNSITEL